MSENLPLRHRIASELLGHALDPHGFGPCPGRPLHTTPGGPRDFVVFLVGPPTGTCVHDHCADVVAEYNRELRRRIGRAEAGDSERITFGPGVAPPPAAPPPPKRPPFDPSKLATLARSCPHEVTLEWLRERSPVWIPPPSEQGPEMAAGLFLPALFNAGESVLVFTRQTSQGDFLYRDGKTFRLGKLPRDPAVPSALPAAGGEGAWFLCQPVTGEWSANPYASGGSEPPKLGRRHGGCVTAWRHCVIESDEAEPALWLRALTVIPLPIRAIYTSGGRSVHALAGVYCSCKSEFDALRDVLARVLCPLGADGAAMTAVRLTRLPGVKRCGTRGKDGKLVRYPAPRLQELAWLNPAAPVRPILEIV